MKSNAWLTKCWSLRRQVSWMLSWFDLLNNNITRWVYSHFVSHNHIWLAMAQQKSWESQLVLICLIYKDQYQYQIASVICLYVGLGRQKVLHLVLIIYLNYKDRNQICHYMNWLYKIINSLLIQSSVLSALRIGPFLVSVFSSEKTFHFCLFFNLTFLWPPSLLDCYLLILQLMPTLMISRQKSRSWSRVKLQAFSAEFLRRRKKGKRLKRRLRSDWLVRNKIITQVSHKSPKWLFLLP